MTPPTAFPTGTFAVSRPHRQLVRVLARTGDKLTITRALLPDEKPLEQVKDEDLMTLKEFEAWARDQPWFRPPLPALSLSELLARIRVVLHPTEYAA